MTQPTPAGQPFWHRNAYSGSGMPIPVGPAAWFQEERVTMGLEENFKVAEAPKESLDDFILLLEQVGEWLWNKGVKQWAPGVFHKHRALLAHRVKNGCLILAYQRGKLAGGCILSTVKPSCWLESSGKEIYLSSLAVARFAAGRGLSTRILDACTEATRKRGKRLIRLDCWDGNEFLKSFYRREGFRMLDAVAEHDYFVRPFEKDVGCSQGER